MDLSHAVHADNCVLDPDTGECWREPPAYTYRDYRWAVALGGGQGPELGISWPFVCPLPLADFSTSTMTSRAGTCFSQNLMPLL